MSVRLTSGTKDAYDAVTNGLRSLAFMKTQGMPFTSTRFNDNTLRSIEPAYALPLYHFALNNLINNENFFRALQTGWRYLLRYKDRIAATADVIIDSDNQLIFAQVNEGPLVESIVYAIKAAMTNGAVRMNEYEARLLVVPALYTTVLWLAGQAEDRDIMIPLTHSIPNLIVNKPILAGDLRTILRGIAVSRIQSYSSRN